MSRDNASRSAAGCHACVRVPPSRCRMLASHSVTLRLVLTPLVGAGVCACAMRTAQADASDVAAAVEDVTFWYQTVCFLWHEERRQ